MSSDDDGDGSLSAMRMAAEAGQEEHDKRDHLTTSGHKLRASGASMLVEPCRVGCSYVLYMYACMWIYAIDFV